MYSFLAKVIKKYIFRYQIKNIGLTGIYPPLKIADFILVTDMEFVPII